MRIPNGRFGAIRRALPCALAITLLCSTTSTSQAGWLSDLIEAWFGSRSSDDKPLINNGAPVPTIADDAQSAAFILTHVVNEAQAKGESASDAVENYDDYATRLAKVMSQLSAEEQQVVFYGGL